MMTGLSNEKVGEDSGVGDGLTGTENENEEPKDSGLSGAGPVESAIRTPHASPTAPLV